MLEDLAKRIMTPIMKNHGFIKKALTWNKIREDGKVLVFNIQKSRYSGKKEADFTINLGVFYPIVWKKCWEKESPKFVEEDDCFPRVRIGQLLANFSQHFQDRWWKCDSFTDTEIFAEEITQLLEAYCLPFWNEMSNVDKVIAFYSSKTKVAMPIEKIYLAILNDSVGNYQNSLDLLNDVSGISAAWAKRADHVRNNLGKAAS